MHDTAYEPPNRLSEWSIPISEEQALAAIRERLPTRVNIAALAQDWSWTRDKVRARLRHWRRSGELPSSAKRRQKAANAAALSPRPRRDRSTRAGAHVRSARALAGNDGCPRVDDRFADARHRSAGR